MGTPAYMSPEQARGDKLDYRTDLFTYGVILYRLLTGKLPFEADNALAVLIRIQTHTPPPARSLNDNVPDELSRLVESLMHKDRDQRPELTSVGGVLPTLRRIRRGLEKSSSGARTKPVERPISIRPQPTITASAPEIVTRLLAPSPLDCSASNGADAPTVKRVQISWSDYLRVPVECSVDLGGGVKMEFVLIPPGKFWMGSPDTEIDRASDEGPLHLVTLTKPFYIGKYQVTQQEYQQLIVSNPSRFKTEVNSPRHPVENVSWDNAKVFWEKLSQKTLPQGFSKVILPTEAQWEYACRAGTRTAFSFGDVLNGDKANCNGQNPYGTSTKGNYLKKTSPVGSYAENPFGLFDMHGNVWEWCLDG